MVTSPGPFVVDEGVTSVATLTASDADTASGDLVWSVAGGADSALFSLSMVGVLEFVAAPDFELPGDADTDGVYELTVQVSDGVNDATADVLVTVSNVIELEAVEGPVTVGFEENGWGRVATFAASSDQDRDGIVWSLGGADAALFSLDEPLGALRFALGAVSPVIVSKPPDFEAPVDGDGDNVYVVTLLPSSPSETAASAVTVTVTVTDVDEPGTVSLSTKRPRVGVPVTATLSDPDGVVADSGTWVWERSTGYQQWATISGADSSSYTPTAADAGSFLRVGVSYSDRHGSGAQAQTVAPEVVAADQLNGLSISTDDSDAATSSEDAWRRMRPVFDPQILHYSVGCNNSDTMTLTMRPASGSSRISVDGVQYTNPGANTPVTATVPVTAYSVVRISLADGLGAQTQYILHCLGDDVVPIRVEKPLGESEVLDDLILFSSLSGILFAVDGNGVPRFVRKMDTGALSYFRFYPDVNGQPRYVYIHRFAYVLNENLDLIRVARTVSPLTRQDAHEFRLLDNGHHMMMAYEPTQRDLSHLSFNDENGQPYGSEVYVEDSAFQIVAPGGRATFNWNSWDHMPLEDCTQHFFPPSDGDYAHLNGLQMIDGLIIASMRGCSRVLAIDAVTGDVVWRVGPTNLTDAEWAERDLGPPPLDIVGDPEGQFCGQHGSSLLPGGNLILYDNGVQCTINPWTRETLLRTPDIYSRALEYALDLDNGDAVFVRDHALFGKRDNDEGELGYRSGHVAALSNGHWLISWGGASPRNPIKPSPAKVFTQADPDTGQEWLHIDGPSDRTRGTVMRPEYLARSPEPLSARFPSSSHTSVSHTGPGDVVQVVVAFSRPVVDFSVSSPSLSVGGATVTAVAPHLVGGERANAYLLSLSPTGVGNVTVAVVAGRACDAGGICAADGTVLSDVPATREIGPPIRVRFASPRYTVREGETIGVPVVVDPTHRSLQKVFLPVVSSSDTASDDDFSMDSGVSIKAGEHFKSASFEAVDDDWVEGPETVQLSIGQLPPGFAVGSRATTTVTITNTDSALFDFTASSGEVSEGSETVLTLIINNGVKFAVDQAITIDVAGSADAVDFVLKDSQGRTLSQPYTVTLAAGDISVQLRLEAVDDDEGELAETVLLSARLAQSGASLGSRTVTIPASDLEGPEVTITPASIGVSEGNDAVFTLVRTAPLGSPLTEPLTVRVQVTEVGTVLGTARPSMLTFLSGDDTVELRVATVDDRVVEDPGRVTALVVADTADPPTYLTGSPNFATVDVSSDDTAAFRLSADVAQVVEGETAVVTVDTGGVTFTNDQRFAASFAGSAVIAEDFAVTDLNGRDIAAPYTLTLPAGDRSTGLRVAAVEDAVDDDGETVDVTLWHGGDSVGVVTLRLVDVNAPPVITAAADFRFAENGTDVIFTFTAVDPEGGTIIWSLSGADADLFSINGGVLRFRTPPDFERPADAGRDNVHVITVEASDRDGATASHEVSVTVTDMDEDATIESRSGSFVVSYNENDTTAAAAFTATDPEQAPIRWSLSGADSAVFEISDRGVLTFLRPPDFESPTDGNRDSVYDVTVEARAGASEPVGADLVVNVVNVDEPGTVILSSSQPQVGAALDASVSDDDGSVVVLSWSWQRLQSGTWTDIGSAASYTPVSADVGHDLRVTATYRDGAGSNDDTATVRARYPTRAAPSGTNRVPDFGAVNVVRSVPENSTPASAVGAVVRATDPDPGDSSRLTYELATVDDLFDVDASTGQIRVAAHAVFDYETPPRSYSATVTATDPSGGSGAVSVTIEVTNVNEAPAPRPDTATTAEDTPVTVSVLANDSDPEGDPLTVSLRDGPINGRISVQPDNTVTYTPRNDFNGRDIFTYAASDGRLTHEADVIVTVAPVNDQPKFPGTFTTRSITQGSPPGTPVGSPVEATDIDGDALTYRLFEEGAPAFTIDVHTGQIRVGPDTVIDRLTQPRYTLRVEATDPHGARVSTDVTITVTTTRTTTTTTTTTTGNDGGGGGGGGGGGPVEDAGSPAFDEGSRTLRSVAENTAPGVNIGGPVTASDPDDDPLTYTLVRHDRDMFEIDSSTGQIRTRAPLDYETRTRHTVGVGVHDSKDPDGEPDTRQDDYILVTIIVTNTDERGHITLSAPTPRTGTPLDAALSDPDGGISNLTWTWEKSSDQTTWAPIRNAAANAYTPADGDETHYLRVAAAYTDGHGPAKTATIAAETVVTVGHTTSFADVTPEGTHTPAIATLAKDGIFIDTECDQDRFCPHQPLKRWVMAIWLIRALDHDPPTTGTSRFHDINQQQWWIRYTEKLADLAITIGCATDPLRYCPDQPVTRAQMASFLVRAFNLPPAETAAGFTDTENNTHAADIDALAAAGITVGCATDPLRYCPDQPVTRAEMATFLSRALNTN